MRAPRILCSLALIGAAEQSWAFLYPLPHGGGPNVRLEMRAPRILCSLALIGAAEQSWAFLYPLPHGGGPNVRTFALDFRAVHEDQLSVSVLETRPLSPSATSRRQWPQCVILTAASATTMGPARARTSPSSSTALCDPTVSIWERNGRTICLLGTAHISTVSAQLAGQLVRDTHPDDVLVELDLKRVCSHLQTNGSRDPKPRNQRRHQQPQSIQVMDAAAIQALATAAAQAVLANQQPTNQPVFSSANQQGINRATGCRACGCRE